MKLLRNRVLVKLLNKDVVSSGGIIVPKTVNTLATVQAEVVLLGERSESGEWWMNVGDIVNMDNPNNSVMPMQEVEYMGEACLIVNENDINFAE